MAGTGVGRAEIKRLGDRDQERFEELMATEFWIEAYDRQMSLLEGFPDERENWRAAEGEVTAHVEGIQGELVGWLERRGLTR